MKLGTSSVVVAAFVGPGTVLTCASAGVGFGYALGWALLFAVGATFVLQTFTAGTGILARRGLGEAIREETRPGAGRGLAVGLVVLGLWVGCAAFELGNLLGAAGGLAVLLGVEGDLRPLVLAVAAGAALILLLDLRRIVPVLAVLVAGMGALFLGAMLAAPVAWGEAVRGLVVPAIPEGGVLTAVALVGTTVVTYNLFLHPAVAKRYWEAEPDRQLAWRRELWGMAVFLPLGGLVSFSILASGAAVGGERPESVAAFARLLEPVAGGGARVLFGLGLFAAGLTSAVTAPLAAAAGVRETFGWAEGDRRVRLVWASVLLTGVAFSLVGWSPLAAVVAAQAANGVLLPLVAGFMLVLTLRQDVLVLPAWYRALGVAVVAVCAGLGVRTLWWVGTQLAAAL